MHIHCVTYYPWNGYENGASIRPLWTSFVLISSHAPTRFLRSWPWWSDGESLHPSSVGYVCIVFLLFRLSPPLRFFLSTYLSMYLSMCCSLPLPLPLPLSLFSLSWSFMHGNDYIQAFPQSRLSITLSPNPLTMLSYGYGTGFGGATYGTGWGGGMGGGGWGGSMGGGGGGMRSASGKKSAGQSADGSRWRRIWIVTDIECFYFYLLLLLLEDPLINWRNIYIYIYTRQRRREREIKREREREEERITNMYMS